MRLGPQVELPTEVTWISTIAKSELFWTWSDPLALESLLQPANASAPSVAATQVKLRRVFMAGHRAMAMPRRCVRRCGVARRTACEPRQDAQRRCAPVREEHVRAAHR